jgi:hypothetical protein
MPTDDAKLRAAVDAALGHATDPEMPMVVIGEGRNMEEVKQSLLDEAKTLFARTMLLPDGYSFTLALLCGLAAELISQVQPRAEAKRTLAAFQQAVRDQYWLKIQEKH